MYKNIYSPPRPEQPLQSHADEPTISITSAFESYIDDVVIKDIKGEGYEGIKTLLYANDMLDEEKNMPMLIISVRLYRWVEHIKTGNQSEKTFQARVVTLKNQIMLIAS